MNEAVPVLPAYIKGPQMVVWCEYERRWHFHSFDGDLMASTGPRVNHCIDEGSPYRKTDYILEYAGRFEDLPAEVQRPKRRGRRS